jgi:hypothetical protein
MHRVRIVAGVLWILFVGGCGVSMPVPLNLPAIAILLFVAAPGIILIVLSMRALRRGK